VIGETTLHEGDVITIDGSTARSMPAKCRRWKRVQRGHGIPAGWADEVARLKVMANADTPDDAARRAYSAPWASACVAPSACSTARSPAHRAGDDPRRIQSRSARRRWTACCRSSAADFKGIFKAMKGLPVTVRLLDPPMHEFLPTSAQLELEIAHLHHMRDSMKAARGTAGNAEAAQSRALPAVFGRTEQAVRWA
jgi:pyruvate,orthophosphate dikinase